MGLDLLTFVCVCVCVCDFNGKWDGVSIFFYVCTASFLFFRFFFFLFIIFFSLSLGNICQILFFFFSSSLSPPLPPPPPLFSPIFLDFEFMLYSNPLPNSQHTHPPSSQVQVQITYHFTSSHLFLPFLSSTPPSYLHLLLFTYRFRCALNESWGMGGGMKWNENFETRKKRRKKKMQKRNGRKKEGFFLIFEAGCYIIIMIFFFERDVIHVFLLF